MQIFEYAFTCMRQLGCFTMHDFFRVNYSTTESLANTLVPKTNTKNRNLAFQRIIDGLLCLGHFEQVLCRLDAAQIALQCVLGGCAARIRVGLL